MFADEIWVTVEVYGPQVDIDRFIALCIEHQLTERDGESSEYVELEFIFPPLEPGESKLGVMYSPALMYCPTWNFREWKQSERGSYEFAFDTEGPFPIENFERLAEIFPTLAFHCECIASMDEFMGFGWFNAPDGGEKFAPYDVPAGYWTTGGSKRDEASQLQHRAVLAKVKQAALEASEK